MTHVYNKNCPVCHKDCGTTALTEIVYTFEPCKCDKDDWPHLVETAWHKKCFIKANQPQPEGARDDQTK